MRQGTEDVAHVLAGVALIEHAVHGVIQEVWVSSTTGAIRTMSPRRRNRADNLHAGFRYPVAGP